VIDGDLQGPLSWGATYDKFLGIQVPLSWHEKYDRFLQAHPPQIPANKAYTPLGWALRIIFVIALFVFVSALVRYFHIGYHVLQAFSNAWILDNCLSPRNCCPRGTTGAR
jgi:hypothetical protein